MAERSMILDWLAASARDAALHALEPDDRPTQHELALDECETSSGVEQETDQ